LVLITKQQKQVIRDTMQSGNQLQFACLLTNLSVERDFPDAPTTVFIPSGNRMLVFMDPQVLFCTPKLLKS